MSLFAELKRRNVIRMAGLYLIGSWIVVQVASTLLPIFDAPGWVLKAPRRSRRCMSNLASRPWCGR